MPPRSHLGLPDASRSLQMLPRSLQMPPGCLWMPPRCLQMPPRPPKTMFSLIKTRGFEVSTKPLLEVFCAIFGRLGSPFGCPKAGTRFPKGTQSLHRPPKSSLWRLILMSFGCIFANRNPMRSKAPFWSDFGSIWAQFWCHFGDKTMRLQIKVLLHRSCIIWSGLVCSSLCECSVRLSSTCFEGSQV